MSDPVRSCVSSASGLARTSYNLVTAEAAPGLQGHDHQNNHLLFSKDCSHCLEEQFQYKSCNNGKHILSFTNQQRHGVLTSSLPTSVFEAVETPRTEKKKNVL